jgi:hypothetical protein
VELNTKQEKLRRTLGLIIPYTPTEIRILKTKRIEVEQVASEYYAEFLTFKDTKQKLIANWIEA